ncbi:RNA-directed DNA polymerase from mobile element jockey-like protein [Willisornis vidua]|uniref:RNA-directed DNA polymerase from mobile element jockey-like protein n=1 Tax=Willisornis vidua TaxID=1566151 RepID=A0ABQ9DGP1_9PASS|nr:RNA-directed DNA polymerase from mobile element jockey-like protein [Willisornis vidua]
MRSQLQTKEGFPLVEKDCVRDCGVKPDIHKSICLDWMHPQVLRELLDIIARQLSNILEWSWSLREVPANVTPALKKDKNKDPANYRPVVEQLILKAIPEHVEDRKLIRSSQYEFTKGKLCLAKMIAFCDGTTGWIDEGTAVDVVYQDFSMAYDTVSHDILIGKLRKCRLDVNGEGDGELSEWPFPEGYGQWHQV